LRKKSLSNIPQPKRSLDIIVQNCAISTRSDIIAAGDIIVIPQLHTECAISLLAQAKNITVARQYHCVEDTISLHKVQFICKD